MSQPVEPLKPLKTWSHLAGNRRRPSEYEIVSTNLMYNARDAESPFELGPNLPLSKWFKRYRHGSPLTGLDWEAFRDPDELTYRGYNILQDGQETYVEGVLDEYDELGHDGRLSPAWVAALARLYTPGRYLLHTLQMASHYLVQIVPSSTIRNCAIYQAGDEFRAVSHLAYRTAALAKAHPGRGFGDGERALWENDPAWQGFRELMEKLLVAYDWGEAIVALNVVAKPAIDEAFLRQLAATARRQGDDLLGLIADSQYRDALRSRHWTRAFVRFALGRADNAAPIRAWIDTWVPLAERAVAAWCADLPDSLGAAAQANEAAARFRESLQLTG